VVAALAGIAGFLFVAFAHSSPWQVIVAGILANAYISLGYGALPALVVADCEAGETGVATGMNAIARTIGASTAAALVAAAVLTAGTAIRAHHAFAAEFDVNKPITLTGTLKEWEMINPHSWFHVEVKEKDGKTAVWMVEGGSPNQLIRNGVTKKTIPIGTHLVIDGYLAKDGTKKAVGRNFVLADGSRLTYMHVTPLLAAIGAGNAEGAIDASFQTWDDQQCTTLDVVKRPWNGGNPSAILAIPGLAPVSVFSADIVTMGYLPGALFDAVLGPGASASVLGVTFTFVFLESAGGPESDIDGDGRIDTALKEVWYNNAFDWTLSGLGNDIDVETVALHENGHALELGHYGKISGTLANLRLHASPRAVMNAAILGTLRSPKGTDNAAFCGNFGEWE
jgi:hypothetical protein